MTHAELLQAIRDRAFVNGTSGTPIAMRGANEYRSAPWLFDFRAVAFDAVVLDFIAERFWETYASQYPFQVAGAESAAIPFVTAIVLKGRERGMPVNGFFIRKSRKRDGLLKMFEGKVGDEPVILVDDIINSGQSMNKQVVALLEARKKVTDIFVILRFRDTRAYSFAIKKRIGISSLFSLEDFGLSLLSTSDNETPHNDAFEEVWRFAGGEPHFNYVVEKSAPVIDNEHVYFGTDNSVFTALDQNTGAVMWTFKTGPHPKGIFSTPIVYNNTVYFGAYDGSVYALDAMTGETRWRYREADWVGSSPSLSPDLGLVYIGLEFGLWKKRGGIVALSAKDGSVVWQHRTADFTHGSPLYIPNKKMVVIGSNDGIIYAYDARTGQKKWEYQTGGDIKSAPAYDLKRELVLAGSWDGALYALHAERGNLAFRFQTHESIFSTPLVRNDLVYIGSLDKFLYAINLDTGLSQWHFQASGRIFASPVIVEGSLWIGANDGRLYELDPETGMLQSFFQASERIVNAIAYNPSTRRFFVPTHANEVICLLRKENKKAAASN
jgi:outer membrane protein assembly factor BamB/adenine/guanine phosphoribosyltransferase-like PRPP-binding protein